MCQPLPRFPGLPAKQVVRAVASPCFRITNELSPPLSHPRYAMALENVHQVSIACDIALGQHACRLVDKYQVIVLV